MAGWSGAASIAWLAVAMWLWQGPDVGATTNEIRVGSWIGTFAFPAGTPRVRIDLQLHDSTADEALGPAHAALQRTSARHSATTLTFAVPGVPTPLTFRLSLRGSTLLGPVTQGALKGQAR